MKKQITIALLGLGVMFVLVASASAQTARRITVQIPFDFFAGNKRLPAGHYTVRRISYVNEKALLISSDDGRATAIVMTSSSGTDKRPQAATLAFRQYGDSYFFAAASIPGTADVRETGSSKSERRLARELAEQSKPGDAGGKTITVMGSVQ